MSQQHVIQTHCDVCGDQAASIFDITLCAESVPPVPPKTPFHFRPGYGRGYDLCEECALPLVNAFMDRAQKVQAERIAAEKVS